MRPGTASKRAERHGLIAALVGLTLLSCTDATLEPKPKPEAAPLDDDLALRGAFCAQGADSLEAFLKILLIVDRSNSMQVTDPGNQRVAAIQELLARFIDDPRTQTLRAGTEVALVGFFGDVVTHTRGEDGVPGFSGDGRAVLRTLPQLAQTGSNTSYEKSLAQAFLLLDADMAALQDVARARTRYEVVFLSDGMPFPDQCAGESNAPTAAVRAAERLRSLSALHRVQVRMHTAFAADPRMFLEGNDVDQCGGRSDPFERDIDESVGAETRALLMAMAAAGGGTFTQFDSGDAISFAALDFPESRRVFGLSSFLAANLTARPTAEGFSIPDSDGDGLSDADELLAGTRVALADSDGDGHDDALELRFRQSGLDPLDPSDARCDALGRGDTDGDGIRDCEELLAGTRTRAFDSDFDGLPDPIELRFGGDPSSPDPLADHRDDGDEDGGSNAEELRWHTDPTRDDVAWRTRLAYRYGLREQLAGELGDAGQACYDFEVENITLASTVASDLTGRDGAGWNRVMLYFAQTPYDDPLGPPIYRVGCVDARFVAPSVQDGGFRGDLKSPASGRFTIPTRRPADTWRRTAVLRPDSASCGASVDADCGLGTWWCRQDAVDGCSCRRPGDDTRFPCPACNDGIDNDGDGQRDFPHDPDCATPVDDDESPGPACGNGVDDDGDGRVDWPEDPGCDDLEDASEADSGSAPACANGLDDDDDGTTDFPEDPNCFAASDTDEGPEARAACEDGVDNDGDGFVDLADEGCSDGSDGDESGPGVCFYCQSAGDALPGQCDLSLRQCRPRSGTPLAGACVDRADCRGAPCVDGVCRPCVQDGDCGEGAICDPVRGWCLEPAWRPEDCANPDACEVDGALRCRGDEDCAPGGRCDRERGWCLMRVFETRQCESEADCDEGICDAQSGWCLPAMESARCRSDDDCPFGRCLEAGACDQQSFVLPEDFDPARDCLRAH